MSKTLGIFVDVESMYFSLRNRGKLDYGRLRAFWQPIGELTCAFAYGLKRKNSSGFISVLADAGFKFVCVENEKGIYVRMLSDIIQNGADTCIICSSDPVVKDLIDCTIQENIIMGELNIKGMETLSVPQSMVMR